MDHDSGITHRDRQETTLPSDRKLLSQGLNRSGFRQVHFIVLNVAFRFSAANENKKQNCTALVYIAAASQFQ